MKQKREWSYHEWSIPCPMDPYELARLCGIKPRTMTKKEQALWDEIQKTMEQAKKWKKKNHH